MLFAKEELKRGQIMRFHILAVLLLGGSAIPAIAQNSNTVERRVERLEHELRAVQRQVFPGGRAQFVEPEIRPQQPGQQSQQTGLPATSAIADLAARVDALEAQLSRLTGQAEENAFRLRQLEESFNQYRRTNETRMREMEGAGPPAAAVQPTLPAVEPARSTSAATAPAPPTGDPAEDAYTTGFRLWEQKQFAEAQKVLEAMAAKYPKHRRASWARNLAGRAYLDDGKPASAAKIFLANYQADPKGERAQDSLYFLGQSLVALKRPQEACKAYEELQEVYGSGMRDWVKQRLPKARTDAKCS
jgi:TolA-binding protein